MMDDVLDFLLTPTGLCIFLWCFVAWLVRSTLLRAMADAGIGSGRRGTRDVLTVEHPNPDGQQVEITCDCGRARKAIVTNSGVSLEWSCPTCGRHYEANV